MQPKVWSDTGEQQSKFLTHKNPFPPLYIHITTLQDDHDWNVDAYAYDDDTLEANRKTRSWECLKREGVYYSWPNLNLKLACEQILPD